MVLESVSSTVRNRMLRSESTGGALIVRLGDSRKARPHGRYDARGSRPAAHAASRLLLGGSHTRVCCPPHGDDTFVADREDDFAARGDTEVTTDRGWDRDLTLTRHCGDDLGHVNPLVE